MSILVVKGKDRVIIGFVKGCKVGKREVIVLIGLKLSRVMYKWLIWDLGFIVDLGFYFFGY